LTFGGPCLFLAKTGTPFLFARPFIPRLQIIDQKNLIIIDTAIAVDMVLVHRTFFRFFAVPFANTPGKPHDSVNAVHHVDFVLEYPVS
jgi:hypothetical protein